MNEELEALLLTEGLINVRGHRHLARRVAREVGRETLVRLLPGIYAAPKDAHDFQVRAKALALADPNAIFVRHTAARLTWWEELSVPRVQAVTRRAPAEGFSFEQRSIPPDLRVAGTQAYVTAAALTVLELIGSMGGKPISEALRRGATTLEELREAIGMMPGRRGNKERWRLLLDSAHEPWSELEREAHRLMRDAGIDGWVTNHPVVVGEKLHYLDIAFPELRLNFELDGWEFHSGYSSFVEDRRRDVNLSKAGWSVLRFTDPSVDELVEAATVMIPRRRHELRLG